MTRVVVTLDETQMRVLVSGHSGYDDIGKDIVCAGISSIMNYVTNLVSELTKNFEFKEDSKKATMELVIKENGEVFDKIIKCLIYSFECMKDSYSNYLELEINKK